MRDAGVLKVDEAMVARAVANALSPVTITDARAEDHPLVYVNAAFERMTGFAAADVLGRNCRFLQTPRTSQVARERIRTALERRQEIHVVLLNQRADGTEFWNELAISPVPGSSGEIEYFIGVQADVSDRVAALESAANALVRESDARHELEAIMEALPIGLAFFDPDLRYLRTNPALERINGTPGDQMLGRRLDEVVPDVAPAVGDALRAVLRSGASVVDQLVTGTTPADPEHPRHWAVNYFPLRSDSGSVVAAGCVVADETARIEAAARERVAADRLRLLVDVSTRLEEARSVQAALQAVAAVLDGFYDGMELDLEDPAHRFAPAALSLGHLEGTTHAAPVMERGARFGTITIWRRDRELSPTERRMLDDIGRRLGATIDQLARLSAQRRAVEELQEAMLPPPPVPRPGLDLAARYRAAGEAARVGGDWYDVIDTGPDKVTLVVGDVTGHGLAAAASMGQLRHAAAAFARVVDSPAAILTHLDELAEASGTLATVVLATVDLRTGIATWSSAGHPMPLVHPAGGRAHPVERNPQPLLGLGLGRDHRLNHVLALGDGDRLVLYTDGLVEVRDRAIDQRIAELASLVQSCASRGLVALVETMFSGMVSDQPDDDAVALVAEWKPVSEG